MKKKIQRVLLSERGDSSYISSFVYIFVLVIMIAFIINVFHIVTVKQEMDHMADQIVKQIEIEELRRAGVPDISAHSASANLRATLKEKAYV